MLRPFAWGLMNRQNELQAILTSLQFRKNIKAYSLPLQLDIVTLAPSDCFSYYTVIKFSGK